jgi:soluble lytic murein transglycosylase-like protein
MTLLRALAAAVVVFLWAEVPAEAQIYSWRDASGTLVLSDQPRPDGLGEMTTYAVRGAASIRTTLPPKDARQQGRYDDLIVEHARSHGLSADLVRAVIQAESGFNPNAISPKGAMGLMQLMPATAREVGVANPFHPAENIRGGVTYLARLLARYDQNVELALAAYNAGPASVERYGNAVPPYKETRNYVSKITSKTRKTETVTAPPPAVIYKWTEIIDGRPVVRYSNVRPNTESFEIVGRR